MLEGRVTLCIVSLSHSRWPEKTSQVDARYQPCHFPANSSAPWHVQTPPAICRCQTFPVTRFVLALDCIQSVLLCATLFSRDPSPSICTVMVSPGLRNRGGFRPNPTPPGVPVVTTVPGSNVMTC